MQNVMETVDIMKVLPHKHPFLLVDRITEREVGERVVGIKAVTYSENLFLGHYPEDPILPGSIMIEAASQVAGLLVDIKDAIIGYVIEVKKFKFKAPVKPGHLLEIEAVKKVARGPFVLAEITLKVGETLVGVGELQIYIEKINKKTVH